MEIRSMTWGVLTENATGKKHVVIQFNMDPTEFFTFKSRETLDDFLAKGLETEFTVYGTKGN